MLVPPLVSSMDIWTRVAMLGELPRKWGSRVPNFLPWFKAWAMTMMLPPTPITFS